MIRKNININNLNKFNYNVNNNVNNLNNNNIDSLIILIKTSNQYSIR
jgi:hypothetical protein